MPFTLTPDQSEKIKDAVQAIIEKRAISESCGDIRLFPDTDIEGDDILHIVIVLNGDSPRTDYERADATIDILNSPTIRQADIAAFPVPHFVRDAEYPTFMASLVSAPPHA